ncbi:hypothetical protein NKG94_49190 [Micromonospora sp. M12]
MVLHADGAGLPGDEPERTEELADRTFLFVRAVLSELAADQPRLVLCSVGATGPTGPVAPTCRALRSPPWPGPLSWSTPTWPVSTWTCRRPVRYLP